MKARLDSVLFVLLVALLAGCGSLAPTGSDHSDAERTKLLVRNATIVPMRSKTPEVFVGYLLVANDGRIEAIGPGEAPPHMVASKVVDATDKLLIPGFVSGHNHLWQSPFRGMAADSTLYGWVLAKRETINKDRLMPQDVYYMTLHGGIDHLQHGITTVYNHAQANRLDIPHYYEEQFAAELDLTQRFVFGYRRQKGMSVERAYDHIQALQRQADEHTNSQSLLKFSVTGLGMFYGDPDMLDRDLALAALIGSDLQMHWLEDPTAKHKQQFIELLAGTDPGPDKISFAHFIHTNDQIRGQAADKGMTMIWNPLANGRLGSGLPDIPKYLEMGIAVGMGIDGQASADIASAFENMRLGLYSTRMAYQRADVMSPYRVLWLHTAGTAEVIGVADRVGSLETGKFADFLIIDPRRPDTGPVVDPVATLVLACNDQNIESVYVGGEQIVSNGSHPMMRSVSDKVREIVQRYRAEPAPRPAVAAL